MWIARLARIAAVLVLVTGASQVAIGLLIATETIGPHDEAMARFLPGKASTGQAIDRGALILLIGLALGTLAEIALKK